MMTQKKTTIFMVGKPFFFNPYCTTIVSNFDNKLLNYLNIFQVKK